MTEQTPRRIPQWVLILITLICIPLIGWTYLLYVQGTGKQAYHACIQEQKELGIPTTLEELYASTDPVDVDRQQRLRVLLKRIGEWDGSILKIRLSDLHGTYGRIHIEQEKWNVFIQEPQYSAMRADMQELADIYNEGPCTLSMLGWLKTDYNNELPVTGLDAYPRALSLMAMKMIHRWIALTLINDASTEADIQTFTKLQSDLQRSQANNYSIIGLMISVATDESSGAIRLYRSWATHTAYRFDVEHTDRAKKSENRARAFYSEAIIGQEIMKKNPSLFTDSEPDGTPIANVQAYINSYWAYRYQLPYLRACYYNAQLSRGHVPTVESPPEYKHLTETIYTTIQGEARSRMRQLSAVLLAHYREHAQLPADADALRTLMPQYASFLDTETHQIGISYERLDAGRFRCGYANGAAHPYGLPQSRSPAIYGKPVTRPLTSAGTPDETQEPYNFCVTPTYIEINAAHTQHALPQMLNVIPSDK